MIFKSSKLYDVLKWIALVGCYALNYLWVNLADIWGFPYADAIGRTITVIGCFIGILIGIGSIRYKLANQLDDAETELLENPEEAEG